MREIKRKGLGKIKKKRTPIRVSSKVLKVLFFIHENFSQKIPLNKMAGLVELHSDYFSRKFKKETGFPFHGYVLQCRINLSIYLLRETDKKIKEIFREVGFNQPEIFSRNFKRVVGCSPRLFRMLESPIQEGLHEKVFARVFSELGDFQERHFKLN